MAVTLWIGYSEASKMDARSVGGSVSRDAPVERRIAVDANVGEMSGRPVLPFPCYTFKRKRMVYSAVKKSQVPLRQPHSTRDDGDEIDRYGGV